MKIRVLDGLRGYAALMIVLAHMPRLSNTEIGLAIFHMIDGLKLSYLGVDIFFILSGFLITRIIIKEKKEQRFSLKSFYIKRALRIFPIYYLAIIICGFLFSWKGMEYLAVYGSNYYFSFHDILHPLEHTWSLAVEEHYYLLWPLLIYFCSLEKLKKYTLPIIVLIVTASLILVYSSFEKKVADSMVYMGTQFRILSLGLGSLLAFHEYKVRNIKSQKKNYLILFTGIIFYLLAIISVEGVFGSLIPKRALLLFFFSICSLLLFIFVLLQENRKSSFNDLFNNKPIAFIGKISYGIYLYHYPIFFWWGITKNQLDSQPVTIIDFALPILFVFVLASLSYWFIEKPLINYKRKLVFEIKPLRKRPAPIERI
ncbi:acyltransferase family protein [Ascidiimonas sp. W6]|uniref:acyltransferase family protein n=1 Tax=Ascidiimonas meishanensis TaxID=3128903 RepID=UPI0030ECC42B